MIQISATLDEDVSMPAVRAYMVLSVIAGYGETLKCVPSPEAVDTFDGRDIDAWVVSERTDTEIQDAVASVPEVAEVHVFEAASDAALDAPDEVEEAVTAPPAPPVEALAVDVPAGEAPAPAPTPAAPPAAEKAAPAAKEKNQSSNKHGGSSTVRVDAERLDQLMHFMGELVLHRTQVEALIQQADVPGLSQAMQNLTRTSHALQSMVMQVRMIPVEAVFLRFPRLVRDLSTKLGKQVELQLVGKDTELDRTVVDALGDPLVHLVRNSLDHGLEGVEERVRGGQAGHGHAGDLRPPRRRQRDHHGRRRRSRHRRPQGGREGRRARADRSRRGRLDRHGARRRAAVHRRVLHRGGHERHLRPRRRHGRGPRRDPRARRRGHHDLRATARARAPRSACR